MRAEGEPAGPEPAGSTACGPASAGDFAARVQQLGALAEPVRRRLYEYVVAQPGPVTRDQAAAATDVPRHTARFHLERLVADGLLETRSRRLSGRSGPGAGRPSKLYLRAATEVAVSVPERRYDLAARILAAAVERAAADGTAVAAAVEAVAAARGRALAEGTGGADDDPLLAACRLLAGLGYEPHRTPDGVVLVNCPFHALAADHTALVCGMNLALVGGALEGLGADAARARLDPAPGRCCVVLGPVSDRP